MPKIEDIFTKFESKEESINYSNSRSFIRSKSESQFSVISKFSTLNQNWTNYRLDSPKYAINRNQNNSDILLDDQGYPHVAYGADHLYYAWYDGAKWQNEIVDNAWGVGRHASLSFDNSGNPQISYYDASNYDIKIAHKMGKNWQISTTNFEIKNIFRDDVGIADMVIDRNGYIHISYFTFDNEDLLKYSIYDGNYWFTTNVSNNSISSQIRLVLDHNGLPHLLYMDNIDNTYVLKHAWHDITTWRIEQVHLESIFSYSNFSLTIDQENNPNIICFDSDRLTYIKKENNNWQAKIVTQNHISMASINLDSYNNPIIVYYDLSEDYLKIAKWTGIDWDIQNIYQSESINHISFLIDTSEKSQIIFYDISNASINYAYFINNGWGIDVIDYAYKSGTNSSLVLDSNDFPHISYDVNYYGSYHENNGSQLKYAWWGEQGWKNEIIDNNINGGSSIAISSQDNPYIVYNKKLELKIAWKNQNNWQYETIDNIGTNIWNIASIKIDKNDIPHVCYFNFKNNELRHAWKNNNKWQYEVIQTGIQYGSGTSLALDKKGYPHIGYKNGNFLNYVWKDENGWHYISTIDNISTLHLTIILDDNNKPHIGYYGNCELKYAHMVDGSFVIETLLHGGWGNSMALDSQNRPYFSYYNMKYYQYTLELIRWDGISWVTSIIDNNIDSWGNTTLNTTVSIKLDSNDNPFISYYDTVNGDLKFATISNSNNFHASITHLEITQAIQDEGNTIPLITGKPTFVRVYLNCGLTCASTSSRNGVLKGFRDGIELPNSPLSPINKNLVIYNESFNYQRGYLNKTMNFILPSEWTNGEITLRADVGSDQKDETINFNPNYTVPIAIIPVRYNYSNINVSPDNNVLFYGHSWTRKIYPNTIKPSILPELTWEGSCFGDLCNDDELSKEIQNYKNISLLRRLQGAVIWYNLFHSSNEQMKYAFGWLSEEIYSGGLSGGTITNSSFGSDNSSYFSQIFAHEVGHLFGHKGVKTYDCPQSKDTGEDWPYTNAKIQEFGLDGNSFGFLMTSDAAIKNPETTFDYMSYCGDLANGSIWTSPYTYKIIFSEAQIISENSVANLNSTSTISDTYFIASGTVYTDDTALIDPIWVFTPTNIFTSNSDGTGYCLETENNIGAILSSNCFDLSFKPVETDTNSNADFFNLVLPYPDGLSRIVLRKGNSVLTDRLISANKPEISLSYPNGGEIWNSSETYTITWTANDLDNDSLFFNVFYSPDGNDWNLLGTNITDTQLVINAINLPGGNSAKIRVMASDGVNTSIDESNSSFFVESKVPEAKILFPEAGGNLPPATPVIFQGIAYDLEDENLINTALSWSSNIDGYLGSGDVLIVTLSPGKHLITFTAADSSGNFASDVREIYIGPYIFFPAIFRK